MGIDTSFVEQMVDCARFDESAANLTEARQFLAPVFFRKICQRCPDVREVHEQGVESMNHECDPTLREIHRAWPYFRNIRRNSQNVES